MGMCVSEIMGFWAISSTASFCIFIKSVDSKETGENVIKEFKESVKSKAGFCGGVDLMNGSASDNLHMSLSGDNTASFLTDAVPKDNDEDISLKKDTKNFYKII